MKRLSLIFGIALTLCVVASANIIPTANTITGVPGNYLWTYQFQLSADQNVNVGTAPSGNPVPHENLALAGFVTIYDFGGYIPGTCSGPAGWICTAQNVGFTPDDVLPADNSLIVNLTWAHTSGSTLLGQPSGLDLGSTFSARSLFNSPTLVSYTSRAVANSGPQAGTIADNVGNTQAPLVPEPMSMVLIGSGLIGFVWLARRVRK